MPLLRLAIVIDAPIELCFDLARDLDLHQQSLAHTAERAVGGRRSGLIELGEEVTWEAIHFGVRQRLTARITAFERPHLLVDEMVRGPFAGFSHCHEFVEVPSGTLMSDRFDYTSPLGPLGRIADRLFLERYLRRLLWRRNVAIKRVAERQ